MLKTFLSARGRALTTILGVSTLAIASHAVAAGDSVAGRYRYHGGPDVASELVLRDDGRFDYFLMAGSLDEQSRGTWQVDGRTLQLLTVPKPKEAVFSSGAAQPTADGKLVIRVTDQAGRGIAAVHFVLGFNSGPPVEGYTQDYGWSLDQAETRRPTWIEFSVPIYRLRSTRFVIDLSRGNDLSFILTPNDLGTIDFTGIKIDIEQDRLIMHRDGASMTFEIAD